jgi:hypothetical protein
MSTINNSSQLHQTWRQNSVYLNSYDVLPNYFLSSKSITHLLVIILSLVVDNVEEAKLIDTLGCGHNTEPIAELLLLQELLCPTNDCQQEYSKQRP